MNIMVRRGIKIGDDKGKQPEEDGWVRKAPKKEVGFDFAHTKETFMEAMKSFIKASTSGSQHKVQETSTTTKYNPSMFTMLLETCMKLICNRKAMKGLQELINKCAKKENIPDGHRVVRKI